MCVVPVSTESVAATTTLLFVMEYVTAVCMKLITPGQIHGAQFEIWMEKLLKDNDYWLVRRNILYFRDRYQFRQVDLEYQDLCVWNPLVILELKYSSGNEIPLQLRHTVHKAGQLHSIETLLDEIEERRKFVGGRKVILATNMFFHKEVYQEVRNYGKIELYDQTTLLKLSKNRESIFSLSKKKSMEEQILGIEVGKYRITALREQVD